MNQESLQFVLNPEDVTDSLITKKCKTLRNALRLCRDCCPLTDKEIIEELRKKTGYEYQQSHFTEALNGGHKNFDPDHVRPFEDVCSNWIPTRYLVLSRGCEMKPKKEALELKVEALEKQLEQERVQHEAIKTFLKEIGAKL
jgi:hypothetical protein